MLNAENERKRPREVKQLTTKPCLVGSYNSEEVMLYTSSQQPMVYALSCENIIHS
jgi:hypothetical protein